MTLSESLNRLQQYIEAEEFKGFDPYDALKSPIFKLPFLRSNKFLRFGTQQMVKRIPFNTRPLLLIPKGYNPVTLGLCIQAYSYLYLSEGAKKNRYLENIDFLVDELIRLIPDNFSGACWGYDFDWEARNAKIPAYQPTVVATGIIANALFIAHKIIGHNESKKLVQSAAKFIVNDLNRSYKNESVCFSYSPFDNQQVFNASMKGARLLSQAYYFNRDPKLLQLAKRAVEFVVSHQKGDGSWGYSLSKKGDWSDNYHTGYVLDCLDEYQKLSNDFTFSDQLKRGYSFYIKNFITEIGIPKFYSNKIYPIDCTAASQFILTTTRFGDISLATRSAEWMSENMQKSTGSFRFRKYKHYSNSTSFMRWSDAWLFAALSYLRLKTQ
jgi:hypothetical protein